MMKNEAASLMNNEKLWTNLMVYVHPNHRHCGVASALIKGFADECAQKNGIPYYVCANSAASAKLAESLNIKKIRKETIIYELK